ncbi:hypothetical protein COB57_00350 [Candidatus Peregrinibacteria bacterium]|nr:MAG: hypothetical protein COB57_00350 [Candidatus Peregrinibacteria bacterium]
MRTNSSLTTSLKVFLFTKLFAYSQQAFVGIFMNIYLWRMTNDFYTIAFYNIIYSLFHGIAIIPSGKIIKEYNRLLPLRLGLLLKAIFLSLIIFLQQDIIQHLGMVAAVGGIANGLYWASDDTLKIDLSTPENRLTFASAARIAKYFSKGLVPLIAGYIIIKNGEALSSYSSIFVYAFVITFISLISSFFIVGKSNSITEKYRFFSISSQLLKNKKIRIVVYSALLSQFSETLPILLSLLLFLATGSEFSIGGYQFITLFIGVISNYLLMQYFNRNDYKKLLKIGGIMNFIIVFILFFQQSFAALLLYGILSSLFSVTDNPRHPIRMDTISNYAQSAKKLSDIRVESLNLIALFDILGKILSYVLIGFLSYSLNFYLIASIAVILSLGKLSANFILANIHEEEVRSL